MTPKILLVEDNFVTADEICDRLTLLGFDGITTVYSGAEAIERAEELRPDLILMDIRLGSGIDGIETARRIQARRRVPVIYLTAFDNDITLARAKITSPSAYLLKPVRERELQIAIDIALYKHQVEIALQQSERELRKANATKDRFFSIIAHDLRSPLMGIMSGTELLKQRAESCDDALIRALAHELDASAQRVFAFLENLLIWGRAQQDSIPYEPQAVKLAAAANYCLNLLHEHAAHKQITLTTTIAEDLSVQADREMLSTIFRNLLSNAIKFTPEGGRVAISAQAHADMVEVAVADTGVGMGPEKLQKLFKVGERNRSSQGTAGERGTGLGLLLCEEFVERHGGRIRAESEEGRGTTFRFTLPGS